MMTNDSKCGIMLRNLEKKLKRIYGENEEIIKNSVSSLLLLNQKIYIEVIPHQDWSLYELVLKGTKSKLYKYFMELYSNKPDAFLGVGVFSKKGNQSLVAFDTDRWMGERRVNKALYSASLGLEIVSLNNFIVTLEEENSRYG